MAALSWVRPGEDTASWCRVFDRTGGEVNLSLQELEAAMEATVAATSALSCGTNDRADNERSYLELGLKILSGMMDTEENGIYEDDALLGRRLAVL